MVSLPVNEIEETVLEPERRQSQAVPVAGLRITGQHVEGAGRVLAYVIAAGHQTDVCVDLGRGIVVVAGGQMDVAADAVVLAAHDKGDLTVGLKSCQTVDHVAARMLQHTRPDDIVLLIEACFELDQDRDLFSVLRGLCQGCDDR